MKNLSIRLRFSLDSPLHITGDQVRRGVSKSTYLRRLSDNTAAAIPATTVKGILRSRLEYLLRGLGKEACCSQNCGKCMACDIFGHPRGKSPLIFQDAVCDGTIAIRPGVRIDRKRKIALEKHLFSYEIVEGDTFETEIKGFFESCEKAISTCVVIWTAAQFCKGFGAGRSYGLGWSSLDAFEAKIDGKDILLETIKHGAKEVFQ